MGFKIVDERWNSKFKVISQIPNETSNYKRVRRAQDPKFHIKSEIQDKIPDSRSNFRPQMSSQAADKNIKFKMRSWLKNKNSDSRLVLRFKVRFQITVCVPN